MSTTEEMQKRGPEMIETAIKVMEKAMAILDEVVDPVEEVFEFARHEPKASWRNTWAELSKCLMALKSKPAKKLAKETWGKCKEA